MAWCLFCLEGESKRCRFVNVSERFPMSSDRVSEHNERNTTDGGAPMACCLCCLQGERKRCHFVNVSGRFSMSSDRVSEH